MKPATVAPCDRRPFGGGCNAVATAAVLVALRRLLILMLGFILFFISFALVGVVLKVWVGV